LPSALADGKKISIIFLGFSPILKLFPYHKETNFDKIFVMSFVRVYIHLVFCTKNRYPFLRDEFRLDIFQHMKSNAERKNIWLDSINGYMDHVHCLIALGKKQSLSEVSQLIKGESSYWINSKRFIDQKFSWQDDYWAMGVGEAGLTKLRKYIFNQEIHHKQISFEEEINVLFDGAKALSV
jgi:REP element-mobilizing transposase RayT